MPDFKIINVEEKPYLYAEKSCSMDPADISRAMGEAFREVWAFMEAREIAPVSGALSVYYDYDSAKMAFRAGFDIARDDMDKAESNVFADVTPAGRVLHFTHEGSYATLRDDYDLMMKHVGETGLELSVPTWEVYLNDPAEVAEEDLRTEIYSALK